MKFISKAEERYHNTVRDLLDWELEERRVLPIAAEAIAELEALGLIVDLVTGEVSESSQSPDLAPTGQTKLAA